jgi:exodeoxyribonuclease VII large subunit
MEAHVAQQHQRLARLEATLQAAHPRRVLERGYSMVQDSAGQVVSNVTSLEQGQTINLQFADGSAQADVHTIATKEENA